MIPFKAFRFLIPHLMRERSVLFAGVFLILITSLSQVAVPRLVGMAVENLESGN